MVRYVAFGDILQLHQLVFTNQAMQLAEFLCITHMGII